MPLILGAQGVGADAASLNHGSQNTKSRDIAVGNLILYYDERRHPVHISLMPDLLSGPVRYQPEVGEKWAVVSDAYHWAGHNITRTVKAPAAAA